MIRLVISEDAYSGSAKLYGELKKDYEKGEKAYLLVPEQYTLQSEDELMEALGASCLLEIQVRSFNALTREVLENTGGLTRVALDEKGRLMLLHRVCRENIERFQIFQKSLEKEGFLKNALQMISELSQRQIPPIQLRTVAQEFEQGSLMQLKIKETADLMELYLQGLGNKYVDSFQRLNQLEAKLEEAMYLKETTFYFNAFYGFTEVEYQVIRRLMHTCKSMTFALTCDDLHHPKTSGIDVFKASRRTALALKSIAKEEEQTFEIILQNKMSEEKCKISHWEGEIQHLSNQLFVFRPVSWKVPVENIHLQMASTMEQEAANMALTLKKLVQEKNMRYRDICVAVSQSESYFPLIRRIFSAYKIPCFMDEKRLIIDHPITSAFESLLRVLCNKFRYEDVFSLIKTGLTPLEKSGWEELENWVLRKNIRGNMYFKDTYFQPSFQSEEAREAWGKYSEENWDGVSSIEENVLSVFSNRDLQDIQESIRVKRARDIWIGLFEGNKLLPGKQETVRGLAENFMVLVQQIEIPQKVYQMQREMENKNLLEEASALKQVWKAAMDTLDQMVEMSGHLIMDLDEFKTIFLLGLKSYRLGLVPPGRDQVVVTTLNRSRQRAVKAEFLLGWCDGWIPKIPSEEGLWTNEDKEELEGKGIQLPSLRWRIEEEDHLELFEVIRRAREQIFISYSLKDSGGSTLQPSRLIGKIKNIFPMVPVEMDEKVLHIPGHTPSTLWVNAMQSYWRENAEETKQEKREINEILQYLAFCSDEGKALFQKWEEFSYPKDKIALGRQSSSGLYGTINRISSSRLETYYGCPFKHFIRHGLRPKERRIFGLERRETGNLLHRCVEKLGLILGQVDDEKLTDRVYLEKTMDAIFKEEAQDFFEKEILESERHRALLKKIRRSAGLIAYHAGRHMAAGKFELWKEEVDFGRTGLLPEVLLDTHEGVMAIEGRIDRMDLYRQGDNIFVKIIDYKSGNKTFVIGDVYFGLDMQLMIYLLAAMGLSTEGRKQILPGGAFYFPMVNRMVEAFEEEGDGIAKKLDEEFIMDGIALNEKDVVLALDKDIETGSSIFKLKGRSTNWEEKENLLNLEEIQGLMSHIIELAKEAAEHIMQGDVAIKPFRRKDQSSACDFCDYNGICGFDQRYEEFNYRDLPAISLQQVKELVAKEQGEKQEEGGGHE